LFEFHSIDRQLRKRLPVAAKIANYGGDDGGGSGLAHAAW
jgi:hypothetical protein